MIETYFKFPAQICMALFLLLLFLVFVWVDFNGAGGKPGGFKGFLHTLVTIIALTFMFYASGAFSELIR